MKQSIFIALVLGGAIISLFIYSPTANFQAKIMFRNAINKLGHIYSWRDDKNIKEAKIEVPKSKTHVKRGAVSTDRNRDLVDSLINRGVISVDKQMFKIYVDSEFWSGMDYPAKNSFCTAVNNLYSGYPLVDKYSGRTLASSNRLGEINIMQ